MAGSDTRLRPGERYTAGQGTVPMTGMRERVRRIERELITEYRATVEAMLPHLSPDTLPRCVDIASAPDEVRGYQGIKLANLVRYRARLDELAAGLGSAARVKGAS